MPWLALTVDVDGASAEALSDALLDSGAESVSIDVIDAGRQRVSALLLAGADPGAVMASASSASGLTRAPHFAVRCVEDEDWVRRSQSQFTSLSIGQRLWVGPSWQEPPRHAAAVVRLDPGLAFGTGSHPSTRLVLEYLARTIRGAESLLDYGCGSGILAIAAAKLGAGAVDAVDLDAQALEVTAANARANGVVLRTLGAEELGAARYDIVVANILAQPLVVLAPLLAARTAPQGRLALSGILESQAAEVADAYGEFAFKTVVQDGWALLEGARR